MAAAHRERLVFDRPGLYDRRKSLEELYDLRVDPHQLNNLAFEDHPRLETARATLAALREDLAAAPLELPLLL